MKNNTRKITIYILIAAIAIIAIAFIIKESVNNNSIKQDGITKAANASEQIPNQTEEEITYEIFESDIILGDKNAPVTVIEYASLSCPHCASFHKEGFDKLKSEYIDTNKVKFIYRDFPLNQPALAGAVLTTCQYNKNKDPQEYHRLIKTLFKTQDSWAFEDDFIKNLESIAKLSGISSNNYNKCINDPKLQEMILKARLKAANEIKIKSTPTFIINNELISGYRSWDRIKKLIDKKLDN